MRWSVWIELRGPAKLWTASIVFTTVGVGIAFWLPRYLPLGEEDAIGAFAVGALGWAFLVLGLSGLVPMLATLYIRRAQPGQERAWHWWINFIGGLLGALMFAIPAALMLPVFLLAYLARPNALFRADETNAARTLGIAAAFSVLGLAALALTVLLARTTLRWNRKGGTPH